MIKVKHRVVPNIINHSVYAEEYKNYKKVVEALSDVWRDFL